MKTIDIENIAELCHEVNKTLCEHNYDYTQRSWADAPLWQKESAVNGVRFNLEHPDATPDGGWRRWLSHHLFRIG